MAKNDPIKIVVTVTIDGERADVEIEPRRTIGDLIHSAITAHGVDEDVDACHLAGPDLLYFPNQRLEDAGIGDGAMLSLRLPF